MYNLALILVAERTEYNDKMRWRLYERRSSSNVCCFCCHVRTGTICLGVYSLLYQLLRIAWTLALAIKPDLGTRKMDDLSTYYPDFYSVAASALSNSSVAIDNGTLWLPERNLSADGQVVELVLNIGYAMFTVSLLYGVVKGYAKFLLPFFCLQVFEFCIDCLVVVGYFTYEPNIKMWITSRNWFPLRDQLLTLNTGWLMLIFGLFAILYLWIKAYFISVVWSCYKYLIQSGMSIPTVSEPTCEISLDYLGRVTSGGSGSSAVGAVTAGGTPPDHDPADSQILLPPKYEDVLQLSNTPPPAFTLQSSLPPPPYSAVTHFTTVTPLPPPPTSN